MVTSFTAFQVACIHEGTSVAYNGAQRKFLCPNDGSVFTNAGVATTGSATKNLKQYTIAINGNTLSVTG